MQFWGALSVLILMAASALAAIAGFFGFPEGGWIAVLFRWQELVGALVTLGVGTAAFIVVRWQIASAEEIAKAQRSAQEEIILRESYANLDLARAFADEVAARVSDLAPVKISGHSRFSREQLADVEWLTTLAIDPIATQCMLVPPVEVRKQVWWIVRSAQIFGRACGRVSGPEPGTNLWEAAVESGQHVQSVVTQARDAIRREFDLLKPRPEESRPRAGPDELFCDDGFLAAPHAESPSSSVEKDAPGGR